MATTPQKLANLLFTNPALNELAEAGDAPGILAAINLRDRERTNDELQTINAIVLALGEQAAGVAAGVLKTAAAQNPLLDAIYVKFCSTGIDLSNTRTQAMIDLLFASTIPIGLDEQNQPIMFDLIPLGQAIKAMGVWYQSLADQEFGEEATEQHVADALVLFARRKLALLVVARYNAVMAAVEAGDVADWEAARAALGAE